MSYEKDNLAGVLASTLLAYEGAQDALIKLVWDRMSEEQKNDITTAAHIAAMARVERIIESRLYDIGNRNHLPSSVNLFARHVEAAVKRAFESEKVAEKVSALVQAQLTDTMSNLHDTVSKSAAMLAQTIARNVVRDVSSHTLRKGLDEALSRIGE